jgi:hypothetical protein
MRFSPEVVIKIVVFWLKTLCRMEYGTGTDVFQLDYP